MIYISLGSNIGNTNKNLLNAISEIKNIAKIIKKSSIYETEPLGYKEQSSFLNMVIKIEKDLSPIELIFKLQEIEHKMGRSQEKEIKNGPRIIDLDILFYEKEVINDKNLKIPHPRLHKRNFILTPLKEISPNLIHPTLHKSIKNMHNAKVKSQKVKKWTQKN